MNTKFPKLPKSLLKPPPGFKKPDVKYLKKDMERLGMEIAGDFKDTVVENIETNEFGFSLSESTIKRKGSDIPLIDSGEFLGAIYQEGTTVSVKNTPRSDSSLTNLQLAIVHEYGTKDRHIPARPVWRKTYKEFKETASKRIEAFFNDPKFEE